MRPRAVLFLTLLAPLLAFAPTKIAFSGQDVQAPADQELDAAGARELAGRVFEAHGGEVAWSTVRGIRIEREHQFAGNPQPIRFRIDGELGTERIYQKWTQPPGEVVWDGEQAWSVDWSLAEVFRPRFVVAIGFYLVTVPHFLTSDRFEIRSAQWTADALPDDSRPYWVIKAEFFPPSTRRPPGLGAAADIYDIVIDPSTLRIAGVVQRWHYAGQLGPCEGEPCRDEIVQVYIPQSYVSVSGLVLPESYEVKAADGSPLAAGKFFGYVLNPEIPEARFVPPASGEVRFDRSSSYRR